MVLPLVSTAQFILKSHYFQRFDLIGMNLPSLTF